MIHIKKATLVAATIALGAVACDSHKTELVDGLCGTAAEDAAIRDMLAALDEKTRTLSVEVGQACAGIARDLGESPPDVSNPTAAALIEACDLARAALRQAAEQDNAEVVFMPPLCTVDHAAQLGCEESFGCSGGDVSQRCAMEALVGHCHGELEGGCLGDEQSCVGECEGEASGSCSGTCEGTCDGRPVNGTCAGECEGSCEGAFDGTCSGSCATSPPGTCSGLTHGGCSTPLTDLECSYELDPPSCTIEPSQTQVCRAHGIFGGTCYGAPIAYEATPTTPPGLEATLETNLPAIANCGAQAERLWDALQIVALIAAGSDNDCNAFAAQGDLLEAVLQACTGQPSVGPLF
jgi:hypothetical protein